MSKPKSLAQIGFEAVFKSQYKPYAHNETPVAWDRIAAAIERAIRRRDKKKARAK